MTNLRDADKDVGGSILKFTNEFNLGCFPGWSLPVGGGKVGSFGLLSTVLISGSPAGTP